MNQQITLNSQANMVNTDKGELTKKVDISLEAKKNYKVILVNARLPHSINNIVTGYNDKIRISHDAGTTWDVLTIPSGMFQITHLQAWLMTELQALGYYTGSIPGSYVYDYMVYYNEAINKCYWTTANNNYWIDLSNNNTSKFNEMLGFTTSLLQNTTSYIAQSDANFNWRDGLTFNIRCNLVRGSADNDIIYTGHWQSNAYEVELFPSASEYHFTHSLSQTMVNSGFIDTVDIRITKTNSNELIPFNTTSASDEAIIITLGLSSE